MAGVPPKKNTAYVFYIMLPSQANTKVGQPNPTIAAGDFKVSIDGGAFNNLATLPTVTPAGGKAVQVSLSAGEMNGDNIIFLASDAAGNEWCDVMIDIQTSTQQVDALLLSSGYAAPDNAGIASILTESASHPTLAEIEASTVLAKESTLTRLLGLCLENAVEDDFTFDGSGNVTSSALYLYDSAAHATTHDKVTGLIGKVTYTGTYSGSYLTSMKGVKNI